MMASTLDTRRIRRSTHAPSQLRDYYREVVQHTPVESGTRSILDAIERSSVSPNCFAPWLGVTKSIDAIKRGLQQNFSVIVREFSVRHMGKAIRSARWKETWDGLGGTEGLLDIFGDLSVNEVRLACKLLGRSSVNNDAKSKCITDLFTGLQPQIFPDATFQTKDGRPLGKFYRHLIPTCTEELVERIVNGDLKGKWRPVRDSFLMRYHPDVIRREQLQALSSKSKSTINQKRFTDMVTQYPTSGETNAGFSPSMSFALQILRDVATDNDLSLEGDVFINDLVRPLLRRAVRKKVPWPHIVEIVDLTMRYLDAHPYAGKEITLTDGDVHHLVAQCWACKPDMFETQLRKLCSDPIFGTTDRDEPRDWEDFLDKIPKKRRYALFQLCLYKSTGLNIDKDEDLKNVKGAFSDELFGKLTAQQALDLFERLRATEGDKALISIWEHNSIFNMQAKFRHSGPDLDLFHVGLLSRNGQAEEARELAMQRIPERKAAATKGKEPEQRTHYAQCALYYAVASGDIQLYQDTLEWAQRFKRDPLVFRELYPQWMAPEVYARLTGIPDRYSEISLSLLHSRVQATNAVIETMFDTACSAIREPSFSEGAWQGVLGLFQRAVEDRIAKSAKLKKILHASDDDMYEALWANTLHMLLSVESKAHRPENKRLKANDPRGPLGCTNGVAVEIKADNIAAYKFFDDLAKARDELWQNLRPTIHPAVLTLPSPFPRGLPIQSLTTPWILDLCSGKSMAPYVAGRVDAALFPDPAEALLPMPKDDETAAAIGSFIDSYKVALHMYIPKSSSSLERKNRCLDVWNHATGPLSYDRMTEEEALRFWKHRRPDYLEKEWSACSIPRGSRRPWPMLPEVDDPSQRHEWNPFEAGRPNQPSRTLDSFTYLDASLTIRQFRNAAQYVWDKPDDCDPLKVPGDEMDTLHIWTSDRDMGEGGVLSAFLFLEMRYGSATGPLLERPFPSVEDSRYPALYLDADFPGDHLNVSSAVGKIEYHLDDVPPSLMQLSAENLLAKLRLVDQDEDGDSSVQELTMSMILRCAESDKPMIARDLVLQTIFSRPNASSWHRSLMKESFLRRLSASDAQQVIQSFADGILNFVAGGKAPESSPENYIKVTTIKLLAQLLHGTEFVDEEYAFSIFSALLKNGTHIDVRLNATRALLSTLDTSSTASAENVFRTLDTLIPVAGNLYETKFVSEQDWKVAEETLVLPHYLDIDDMSPTTELFMKHYLAASPSTEKGRTFIDRILLPTIVSLQQQASRWISLFLKKHGIDEAELAMPAIPYHASRLLGADNISYLPRSVLANFVAYNTFKLAPPAAIEKLNTELKEDISSDEVQAWFRMYALGPDNIVSFRNLEILSLLDKPTTLDPASGITPGFVQEQFLQVFKACVAADAPLYDRLTSNLLSPLLSGSYHTKPWWPTHGKGILSDMINHVDSLRTPAWRKDPNRVPFVLPDTTPWNLLLLDPPYSSRDDTDTDTSHKCETFATQLATFIEDIADGMYHITLEHLKHFLSLDPVSSTESRSRERRIGHWTLMDDKPDFLHDQFMRNRIDVTIRLGTTRNGGDENGNKMPDPMSRAHALRVVVAGHLLDMVVAEWSGIEVGKKEGVRVMVREWRGCVDEEVRRIGWRLDWVFE